MILEYVSGLYKMEYFNNLFSEVVKNLAVI